jgi:hypothetical protein
VGRKNWPAVGNQSAAFGARLPDRSEHQPLTALYRLLL